MGEGNRGVLTAHHNHNEQQQQRWPCYAAAVLCHMECHADAHDDAADDRNNKRKCSKPSRVAFAPSSHSSFSFLSCCYYCFRGSAGLSCPVLAWGLDRFCFWAASVSLYVCPALFLSLSLYAGSNNQVSSVIINISSSSCNNVIIGVCRVLSRCRRQRRCRLLAAVY